MFNVNRMGTIDITDLLEVVLAIPDGTAKIISLDEENTLNPHDPNVLVGTLLLPPLESVIAEADGDEDLYDIHYLAHFNTPAVKDFIEALIAALYCKTNLIFYAPQMTENISIYKFMQFMWTLYGIHIGTIRKDRCFYDDRCIPIWVNAAFSVRAINAEEYIRDYPTDAPIQPDVMNRLISEIRPVGNSPEERIQAIERYRRRCAYNKRTSIPIYDTRR